ncbi:MAG: hypothetical protein WD768_17795 [Phycisphaeraceae bacterium]
MTNDEEFQELLRLLHPTQPDHVRLETSKRMTAEQKFLAGYQLFLIEIAEMREQIRRESPGLNDEDVERLIQQRLDRERAEKGPV